MLSAFSQNFLSSSTGSNGKSLSDVLKNDRESLLKNPIQLIQLIHHEIDHMVEKSRKIEGELSTHFLNKDSSMFVKKEDDDKNSSSPITMISQFVEKLNGSEGGVLASFPINTELVEKFKGSSDILLKAFDTIKDHLGDGSLVSGGCMFSIVACCVAAMLEEIENNAKEEWQKLYSEAKETIDEFKQKISSTLVETIAKLKEIGTETLNEIKRSIQKGCELASSFPKEVREEIENIAKRHLEEFKNVTYLMKHLKEKNFLTNQFEQFHQEFKALVTSFADRFIKELLGNIIGTIVKFFKSIAQVFRGLIKESFGIIIEIVKKIFEFVKSAPERLRKIFDFSGNCMAMLCLSAPQEMIDKAANEATNLMNMIPVDKIISPLEELKKTADEFQEKKFNSIVAQAEEKMEGIEKLTPLFEEQLHLFSQFDSDLDHVKVLVAEIEEKGMNLVGDKLDKVLEKVSDVLHLPKLGVESSPLAGIKKLF